MIIILASAYIVTLGGTAAAVKYENWRWAGAGITGLIGIGVILGNSF